MNKRNKGITLIALVVTIVVLLILAGVSISMLTGENGIINQATGAQIQNSHSQIREAVNLKYTEYKMEVKTNSLGVDFIDYMISNGYISSEGIINSKNLTGSKLTLGNGTGKKDVYIVEKTDDGYITNYYDKKENEEEIWNINDTSNSITEGVRNEDMFDFDSTTGMIYEVKGKYLKDFDGTVDYYGNSNYSEWCELKEDIDTLIIPNSINGVAVKSINKLLIVNVKNLIIEDGIESIYQICSKNDKSQLENISIPGSIKYIYDSLFDECRSLKNVKLGEGILSLGNNVFFNCTNLTKIQIPASLTDIGMWAFVYCESLSEINVSKDNLRYDSRDNCNAIIETSSNTLIQGCKSTIIPDTVTSIGDGAFDGQTELTNINIPYTVTSIGTNAFAYCENLINIIIPSNVTDISGSVFEGCENLTITLSKDSTLTVPADNWGAKKVIRES